MSKPLNTFNYSTPAGDVCALMERHAPVSKLPRVNLDKLRAEGFTITVAPEMTDWRMKQYFRNRAARNLPQLNKAFDELVARWGLMEPMPKGEVKAAATRCGCSYPCLANKIYHARQRVRNQETAA